jgi:hypothetical protein
MHPTSIMILIQSFIVITMMCFYRGYKDGYLPFRIRKWMNRNVDAYMNLLLIVIFSLIILVGINFIIMNMNH